MTKLVEYYAGWLPNLPDDFSESKDWRESDYAGRVEWLLVMIKALQEREAQANDIIDGLLGIK
jgi:hypothetical protein